MEIATIVTSAITPPFKALLTAVYPFIDLDHDGFVTDDDLRIPLGALVCELALEAQLLSEGWRPWNYIQPDVKGVMEKIDPYGNDALWAHMLGPKAAKWLLEVGALMRPRATSFSDVQMLGFLLAGLVGSDTTSLATST